MTDNIVLIHDPPQNCVTIDELRWILRKVKRHTPYYTYFLLRATTGIRGDELLKVKLNNLLGVVQGFRYQIQKPRTKLTREGNMQRVSKERHILFDPWVREELITYLDFYMGCNGQHYACSPWGHGRLFPWKGMEIVHAYWHKLRKQMVKAGFDSLRVARDTRWIDGRQTFVRVVRPHMLRHLALTRYYYAESGLDLLKCQKWIKHEKNETTVGYLHTPEQLGSTIEELRLSWPQLLGFSGGETLQGYLPPEQALSSN